MQIYAATVLEPLKFHKTFACFGSIWFGKIMTSEEECMMSFYEILVASNVILSQNINETCAGERINFSFSYCD